MLVTREMVTLHADFLLALVITCQELKRNEDFKRKSRCFTLEEIKKEDLREYLFLAKDTEYIISMEFLADLASKLTFNVLAPLFEMSNVSQFLYYEASVEDIHCVFEVPRFYSIFKKYIYIEDNAIIFNGVFLHLERLLKELGYDGLNEKAIEQCVKVTNAYFDGEQIWGYQEFDKLSEERKQLILSNKLNPLYDANK